MHITIRMRPYTKINHPSVGVNSIVFAVLIDASSFNNFPTTNSAILIPAEIAIRMRQRNVT